MSAKSRFARRRPGKASLKVTQINVAKVPRMDIKEFVEAGYLLEANRRYFHPLGLALEVAVLTDGSYCLAGIQDQRSCPEGIFFGRTDADGTPHVGIDPDLAPLAQLVDAEHTRHAAARISLLGDVIQPLPAV